MRRTILVFAGHIISTFLLLNVFTGCSSVQPYSKRQERALKILDEAAHYLDEFGAGGVSSPLLVSAQRKDTKTLFAFDPGLTDKELFSFNREEAAYKSATALYTQFTLNAALAAKVDAQSIAKNQANMATYLQSADAFKAYNPTMLKAANEQLQKDVADAAMETDSTQRTAKLLAAQKRYNDITGLSQAPVYPEAATQTTMATAPKGTAFANVSGSRMGDLFKILEQNKQKTPVRPATIASTGDKATIGMLKVLTDPASFGDGQGKKFLFGVSTVSVRPGWRTAKNFTADLSLWTSFEYKPARNEVVRQAYRDALNPDNHKQPYPHQIVRLIEAWNPALAEEWRTELLEEWKKELKCEVGKADDLVCRQIDNKINKRRNYSISDKKSVPETLKAPKKSAPLVVGVSPIVDVQNMDTFEGARQSIDLALQISATLSGAGYGAAGELFSEYARRLETDKQLRASLPTVTSYSNSGGGFGFLVSPRMKVGMSSDGEPEQMMGLESQAFPVLVLVQMNSEDIGVHFEKGGNGNWEPVEPHIVFDESTRWRRFKKYWYWYDVEQSEEKSILLRSSVSALGTGMIGFRDLREQVKDLEKVRRFAEGNRTKCADWYESFSKLLDSELAVDAHADKRDDWMKLMKLSALDFNKSDKCEYIAELTSDDIEAIKKFCSTMEAVFKEIQPTRDMLADLMKNRSTMMSSALVGTGNSQVLPLELFGVKGTPEVAKPTINSLHVARISKPGEEITVFDLAVNGENLGETPPVTVDKQHPVQAALSIEAPVYDKQKHLNGFTVKVKSADLPTCVSFKAGEASSEAVCLFKEESLPKEPDFTYSRIIESSDSDFQAKQSTTPATAKKTVDGHVKWAETVKSNGVTELIKSAIEKIDNNANVPTAKPAQAVTKNP